MIIGRKIEQSLFKNILNREDARFLAIYGRRRVGKTYLVRKFFPQYGSFFEIVGQKNASEKEQLSNFVTAYSDVYLKGAPMPECQTWRGALQVLTKQIQNQDQTKKQILFFDELPWLGSRFLEALDYEWNMHWSKIKNLVLIVCGSAASWMMRKVVNAKGGLYNRLTELVHLKPFDINETKIFLEQKNINYPLFSLVELYFAIGGIPHYLDLLMPGLSVSQNIEQLLFDQSSSLVGEYNRLFDALFDNSANHYAIMGILSKSRAGLQRKEIKDSLRIADSTLQVTLGELESSGFIKAHTPFGHKKRGSFYRISDPYCLFYLKWVEPVSNLKKSENYWTNLQQSPSWNAWAGYSFEWFCEEHFNFLLKALGINGISSTGSKWRFYGDKDQGLKGADVDFVIDRSDSVINICEMKFTRSPFVADKGFSISLKEKLAIFKAVTKTKKALMPILISASGALDNIYLKDSFQKVFTLEDIFG